MEDDLIEDLDELFNIRKMATFDDVPDTPGGGGFWDGVNCNEDGDKWMQPFEWPVELLPKELEHGLIEDRKTVIQSKRKQQELFNERDVSVRDGRRTSRNGHSRVLRRNLSG